jgi:hypothetical protein
MSARRASGRASLKFLTNEWGEDEQAVIIVKGRSGGLGYAGSPLYGFGVVRLQN